MSLKSVVVASALVVFAASLGMAPSAEARSKYPNFRDASQAYNSRVVAGAAPNWYATFIEGDRCSFVYRVVNGQRIRYQVCN